MFGSSRSGGVRGGQDQFNWDDVKVDKHRENYLGNSLMAPVGRWQKGKDLSWYSRDKKSGAPLTKEEEMAAVKAAEHEALMAALGHRNIKRQPTGLTKEDLADVYRREEVDGEERDVDRVSGLGSSRSFSFFNPLTLVYVNNINLYNPCFLYSVGTRERQRRDSSSSDSDNRKRDTCGISFPERGENTRNTTKSTHFMYLKEHFLTTFNSFIGSLIVCFLLLYRQRKDHHHHNPSYHSQSGARPHDSHSRGGAKAERQPSHPHHRRQRHDTDSSDGGSPVPRNPVSHKTAPAGGTQSHRRRHDTDSDH
uniref:Chromosome 1 open reading frame 35 n=1 Tax=Gasterosteus aculeatus TaxID=69293 RepID=G3PZK9_GASAC